MHIVHVAAELAPIAKVGGLGDVIHGLSRELLNQGQKVEVLLPKYDCIDLSQVKNLRAETRETHYTIWSGIADGIPVKFIDSHHPANFFNRGCIYGCKDDYERFTAFCKLAHLYLTSWEKKPDIVHAHDWPACLLLSLYKEKGKVLNIHNMEHQGKDLLEIGIKSADLIITVSPTYEREIKTPFGGFGLENTVVENQHKLHGILNGIDQDTWNPKNDLHIPFQYDKTNVKKGKAENKKKLQVRFELQESNAPLVGCVTRLATQKGPKLIEHALHKTLELGGQFILLGTGSTLEKKPFENLKQHKNLSICLDYDEPLSHQIYAGADMLIIPSIFEPCGLTQLISLRYGTVPVVRRTGGLADTIFDEKNGFTFDFPDPPGVDWALGRALDCFSKNPSKWADLIQTGMSENHSWKNPTSEYIRLYKMLK